MSKGNENNTLKLSANNISSFSTSLRARGIIASNPLEDKTETPGA